MTSHNHPHFAATHFQPTVSAWACDDSDRYDSMHVPEPMPCAYTCDECGTTQVEVKGHICHACRVAILDAAVDCDICGESATTSGGGYEEYEGSYQWADYDLCDKCAAKAVQA